MLLGLDTNVWPGLSEGMCRDNSCSEAALGSRVDRAAQFGSVVWKATAAARFAFMRLAENFPRSPEVCTGNPCVIFEPCSHAVSDVVVFDIVTRSRASTTRRCRYCKDYLGGWRIMIWCACMFGDNGGRDNACHLIDDMASRSSRKTGTAPLGGSKQS